ncbi:MAG: hypothetical protein ACI8W8_002874 [Rhodothermales bacterium]|jgi:hypothetical protein
MSKIKRIPYGKGDFEAVNAEDRYYVDKTTYIPILEQTDFVFLIRPRRFGKTLFLSMLQSYYDINKADRFEEFYRDTWILDNPTDERAKYMILYFNFSVVSKNKELVQQNFNDYCTLEIESFMRRYSQFLPATFIDTVNSKTTAHEKLQVMAVELRGTDVKIYLMIDEYDNFTNTILAEYGAEEYAKISREEGYFKLFFTTLKGIASGSGSALARMFITGVSPVTMDDVTSGFNIGTNITTDDCYSEILGFNEADVGAMIDYYRSVGVFHLDREESLSLMHAWYDNYRFAKRSEPRVFNTDMVLYFMKEALNKTYVPDDLIDENVRVDYGKLRHLVTINNQLNGNFNELELLLANGSTSASLKKSFPCEQLAVRDNFISLLFYFGLITIDRPFEGETRFTIPNRVIENLLNDFICRGYMDACKANIDMLSISRLIGKMAYHGEWEPCIRSMGETVRECMSMRDLIEGERVAQALLVALFHVGRPFVISSERESDGGFIDIALGPFLAVYPDMNYAYLIEMKYLKASEAYDDGIRDTIVSEASAQLDRYAAAPRLKREWQLPPHGEIILTKLVLIFKGRELVHSCAHP